MKNNRNRLKVALIFVVVLVLSSCGPHYIGYKIPDYARGYWACNSVFGRQFYHITDKKVEWKNHTYEGWCVEVNNNVTGFDIRKSGQVTIIEISYINELGGESSITWACLDDPYNPGFVHINGSNYHRTSPV